MKNMANMLKQAREMQKNMQQLQQKMEQTELTGSAGGGLVKITINGKNEVRRVVIDPQVVDKTDVETLEDLVAAAMNDAQSQMSKLAQDEMNKVTGGMNIPGLTG